jgi:hypothetical protein
MAILGLTLKPRLVDANQACHLKRVGCFFKAFTRASFCQGLAWVEMTGGVVELQAFWCVLFNQEVATGFFHNGGHRDAGLPA